MRITRTSLTALVGLLVLTACGGGSEAEPEPILPSSSAPAPSPSASASEDDDEAPVMPEAAKERTAEGVEAFLGYWGEALTYSYNSGSADAFEAISNPGCQSCSATSELIAEVYGGGGSMESDGWAAKQVVVGPSIAQPLAKFDRGREVTRRAGERPEVFPPAESTISFDLDWRAGRWQVDEFALRG